MHLDLDVLRTVLLVSLSGLFVMVLYRRFRERTVRREMPAPAHLELIGLEIAYHPSRLRAWVKVPGHANGTPREQEVRTGLLDGAYAPVFQWPAERMVSGEHWIERPLDAREDGQYFFQISTDTQRTVRQFRLQQR